MERKYVNTVSEEKYICSICGEEYIGYGNNAQPVNDGRCCDECNRRTVIPIRASIALDRGASGVDTQSTIPAIQTGGTR